MEMLISITLVIVPILMYLVFSCYNVLSNKKVKKVAFIITMFTSLYLSLKNDFDYKGLLLFCNIPILICYIKKETMLGIILSIITIIFCYLKYDLNIYIIICKHFCYLLTYLFLLKRNVFDYLFLKISAVIQGFFISFEYFMNYEVGIEKIYQLFLYTVIIYSITFFCVYLFKLADSITNLYSDMIKIKEENKLKNSLFKLTHEIKNPLAVCKGYLDMIDLDDTDKARRYVNIVKTEIDRSLNIMNDFMEYSKIKVNKEIFDMVVLLDELYDSFKVLLADRNIKFNYNNKYEELYVWGDYERLKQVFINIIKNSVEAINDDGVIDLDMLVNDKQVIVTICDNGVGMEDEELKNIKEMFWTTKKNGTGLGVALSNEIVVAHGGTINYNSVKNKGTECVITLSL